MMTEHRKNYMLDWRIKNRDIISIKAQIYRDATKEKTILVNKKYYVDNRDFLLDRTKKYNMINRSKKIEYTLKIKYGISGLEYKKLFVLQNGVCAICLNPETSAQKGIVRGLAVDHNHETKEIRGLLCRKCNLGIGHLQDNINLLERARMYLLKSESKKDI